MPKKESKLLDEGDQEVTVSLSRVVPVGEFGNVRLLIEVAGLKAGATFEDDLRRATTVGEAALKSLDIKLEQLLGELTSPELAQGRSLLTERVKRLESWQGVTRRNLQDIVSKVKQLRKGHFGNGEQADPGS